MDIPDIPQRGGHDLDGDAFPCAPRGELSGELMAYIASNGNGGHASGTRLHAIAHVRVLHCTNVASDDDIQLTLFLLYALAYGSLSRDDDNLEWDPDLIRLRAILEEAYEAELREEAPVTAEPEPNAADVARALFDLTAPTPGPSLSRYVATKATDAQVHELMVHRTIYTLREADPHSWAIPRLTGGPKAALVEIQADEYGGGQRDRMHSELFARTVRGMGLDDTYGAYVDHVPALTLASHNLMSMCGVNRRLRGAIVGHLTAFEMTSSLPCRLYGDGLRRLGYNADVTAYFDEHVEADAVHEQIAARDLAGGLAEAEPALVADIMWGATAMLAVEQRVADHMLDNWKRGASSLVRPLRFVRAA